MAEWWLAFVYNPLPTLGSVAAVLAAAAFLVILRGFLSSVIYLFTLNGNDEFMKAARTRVLWGSMLLVFIYSVWQIIRWTVAFIDGTPRPGTIWLALLFLVILFAATRATKFIQHPDRGIKVQ